MKHSLFFFFFVLWASRHAGGALGLGPKHSFPDRSVEENMGIFPKTLEVHKANCAFHIDLD